jgi:DNA-binding IclR family transcriptional regulator
MELPSISRGATDPAPALGRGLALLRKLVADGPCSLERLAGDTGWPKSSVLRLLTSLEAADVVARDPVTRRFRAIARLVPAERHDQLRERWLAVSASIAEDAGHTLELYRFVGGSLVMTDRHEPEDAAVSVKARIGFQRDLTELDALARIALALGVPRDHWPSDAWRWSAGRRLPLKPAQRSRLVSAAADAGAATDEEPNTHSVRRYAAAVLDQRKLVAAVALAQVCSPADTGPDPRLEALTRDAATAMTH